MELLRLPMLYETSYVIQGVEGDPKRSFIFEATKRSHPEQSRTDQIYERVLRNEPTALDIQIRLMRPKEIRHEMPLEVRVQHNLARMAMSSIHLLAELERLDRAA